MSASELSNHAQLRLIGLPVLDCLGDLATSIRLSNGVLYRVCTATESFYQTYHIPKQSGGTRTITQPNRTCKAIQSWILRRILDPLRVSSACKGFEKGQTIRTNAMTHARSNAVLTVDLADFFNTIHSRQIFAVFRNAGYNRRVAGILTSLCTCLDTLPQGAPTSPRLANLVCIRLDARLLGYVGKRGIAFTRYADDLTFSAQRMESLTKCFWAVKSIVSAEGFTLNSSKTRFAGASRQRCVTGLILTEAEIGIGRKKYRLIRA